MQYKRGRMGFEILGELSGIEVIAKGSGVRERMRLRKAYGQGSWRKLKGIAGIKLSNGTICEAEAHGIGKKEFKIKRLLT